MYVRMADCWYDRVLECLSFYDCLCACMFVGLSGRLFVSLSAITLL